MTTELERRLREALHEDAERARLVNPDGPPVPEARPLSDGQPRQRRARGLVAAAAAGALIAGAVVVAIQDREPGVTTEEPAAALFTDVLPGSTVALPPAPIRDRSLPAVVWSGTELIVWGGIGAAEMTLEDGAAFDPAAGSWRVIAPAPVQPRLFPQVAWTGAEMLVWGGQTTYTNGAILLDGAAYDPATDSWRLLADGPTWEVPVASVWTGDELVVAGEDAIQVGGGITESRQRMAAYDPTTDAWRELADPPAGVDFDLLWTGDAVLTTLSPIDPSTGDPRRTDVARYDLASDDWQPVQELANDDVSLIPVIDADASVRSVLVLAHDAGAPIVVLDPTGTEIGTLPALPADPVKFGARHASGGVWAGDEALFYVRPLEATPAEDVTEKWALDLATQTWRELDAADAPPSFGVSLVPELGVLIGWAPLPPAETGPSAGVVYRPPAPPGE